MRQPHRGHRAHGGPQLVEIALEQVARRSALGQPGCSRSVGNGDELHHDLGAVQLHGIGHRQSGRPEIAQIAELGSGPLTGFDLPAPTAAFGHRSPVPAVADLPPFGVAAVAVEQPMIGRPIALGGHDHRLIVGGSFHQHDIGFLAGLEGAEFGVDRRVGGDHPVGPGFGSGGDADGVPGGPALPRRQLVSDGYERGGNRIGRMERGRHKW